MKATTIKWDLGVNWHKQPIELTRYTHNGRTMFRIDRGQADQRDDCSSIAGLTKQNILDLAEAVKEADKIQ